MATAQESTPASRLAPLYQSLDGELSEDTLAKRFSRPARPIQNIIYEFTKDLGLIHQYNLLADHRDADDGNSHIMVARKGRQAIAGGCLTISSPERRQPLPLEADGLVLQDIFPELRLANATYGEFSRLAVLPDLQSDAVFAELVRHFIKKAIDAGVRYAFNIAPQPLARDYRQAAQMFGLSWDLCQDVMVPERDEYEGIRMVLSVIDLTPFVRPQRAEKREAALAE